MTPPGVTGRRSRRDVLAGMVEADLRRRFGRGRLRTLRWVLEPVAAIGVYLLLVAYAVDRPGAAPGLSIACAVVPFQLVMMSVVSALRCIELRSAILANIAFERVLLPVAAVVSELISFAGALALLGVMMAIYGVAPTPALLLLPVVIAVTFALAVAVAFPVALLGMWVPELQPYVVSATRALYFLAPGIVALDQVSGGARDWLQINPLTGLFEAFRDITLRGQLPAAWELLYPLAFSVALLAVVMPLWRAEERHFAKVLQS